MSTNLIKTFIAMQSNIASEINTKLAISPIVIAQYALLLFIGLGFFNDALAQNPVSDVTANVSSNSLTRVMCNALRVVTGSAGKTFAAFAIISVGIGFFTGKVSWGLMIGVAAGIAAMFGAPSIVAAISGTNTDMMCNIN